MVDFRFRTFDAGSAVVGAVVAATVICICQDTGWPNLSWEAWLAIVTALLFGATLLLWYGADKTSRRQLRAYVYTKLADMEPKKNGKGYEAVLNIHNMGSTPAYDLHYWSALKIMSQAEYDEEDFYKSPIKPVRLGALYPQEGNAAGNSILCTDGEIEAVEKRKERLYFWGQVLYRDAFGKLQHSSWRIFYSVSEDGSEMDCWRNCPDGNDAT